MSDTTRRDPLSPLFALTPAERTLARQCYAADPAPFDALIADVLCLTDRCDRLAAGIVLLATEELGL
jgi:hypothetical protein